MKMSITIGAFIFVLAFVGYTQAVPQGKPFQDLLSLITSLDTRVTNLEASGGDGGGSIIFHVFKVTVANNEPRVISTNVPYRLPRDGTIQNMRIFIESNSSDGSLDVILSFNGSPSSLSETIPPGSTADIDVPGMVNALDGDAISVDLESTSASGGQINFSVSYEIL